MSKDRAYSIQTGLIDLDLLKRQTKTIGKLVDGCKVSDKEIADLGGLWEMLEDFIDQMESKE